MGKIERRPRVLFVDDEDAVLNGLRRGLGVLVPDWPMTFETSPVAAENLALTSPFDVIVSDLRMPRMDGLTLLARIKEAGVEMQSIILTGAGDMNSAIAAINTVNVFRYYTKPCSAEDLAAGIAEAFDEATRRRGAAHTAMATLDALPFAAIAVGPGRKVVFTNRKGAELLAMGGVIIADAVGVCRTGLPGPTAVLHAAIAAAENDAATTALILSGPESRRHSVLVEPVSPSAEGATTVVFVRPLDDRPMPDVDDLRTMFGFNLSEARLVRALVSGQDLREAAEALGLTVSSARTYLKYVFQKTGVNRQSDLIRLMYASMAHL